jgi:hypothetical protein
VAVVYVVQKQMKVDSRTGDMVPRFDLTLADQYGKIEFLLSPRARPYAAGGIITELYEKLETFSDKDFLLLVGNQTLVGFAMSVAADVNNGRVNILQWSGRDQAYVEIKADINGEEYEDDGGTDG